MTRRLGFASGHAALLGSVVAAVAERGDRRGCFLCNAAVDRAPHDAEVERAVTAMIGRLDAAFDAASPMPQVTAARGRPTASPLPEA